MAVNSGYETKHHSTSVGCAHIDDGDQSAKHKKILASFNLLPCTLI